MIALAVLAYRPNQPKRKQIWLPNEEYLVPYKNYYVHIHNIKLYKCYNLKFLAQIFQEFMT